MDIKKFKEVWENHLKEEIVKLCGIKKEQVTDKMIAEFLKANHYSI